MGYEGGFFLEECLYGYVLHMLVGENSFQVMFSKENFLRYKSSDFGRVKNTQMYISMTASALQIVECDIKTSLTFSMEVVICISQLRSLKASVEVAACERERGSW